MGSSIADFDLRSVFQLSSHVVFKGLWSFRRWTYIVKWCSIDILNFIFFKMWVYKTNWSVNMALQWRNEWGIKTEKCSITSQTGFSSHLCVRYFNRACTRNDFHYLLFTIMSLAVFPSQSTIVSSFLWY